MIRVLDHGFVRLVDVMGDDDRICEAARVSYAKGTKSVRDNQKLIHYLWSHGHTSPFEQVVFVFHMKMPIFVARQIVRFIDSCTTLMVECMAGYNANATTIRIHN